MNKLVTGLAVTALAVAMSGAALAGPGNSGDHGRGGGNAGGGNAGGASASAGGGGNGVGGAGMSHNDWTGGWNEYFSSTQVGNGNGLGRRNYGLAVRVHAWRGTWGEQVGGEGGQAHADGDMHRGARVQRYLGNVLGIGSNR